MNLIDITSPPWFTVVSPGVSPAFVFSYRASLSSGQFLDTGNVSTYDTGQPIFGKNKLTRLRVSVEGNVNQNTTFSLYRRTDANTKTAIAGASITIDAGHYTASASYDIDLPPDIELCASVTAGSCKAPVLAVFLMPR